MNNARVHYDSDRYGKKALNDIDGNLIFNVYDLSASDYVEKTLDEWLEMKLPEILQTERKIADLERINKDSDTVFSGNGNMLIGFDEDTGIYTMERIVSDMQADSLDDVGYIMSYRSTWITEKEWYQEFKPGEGSTLRYLEVPVEICHVRLLSAVTGQEIVSFETKRSPSSYSVDDAGIPKGERVSKAGIWIVMQDAFEKNGVENPFPEIELPYWDWTGSYIENPLKKE
jgi:hypothetical protein